VYNPHESFFIAGSSSFPSFNDARDFFHLSFFRRGQNSSPNTITNSPSTFSHYKIHPVLYIYILKHQNTLITTQEITRFAFLDLVQSVLFNSHVTFNRPTFKCKTDIVKALFLFFELTVYLFKLCQPILYSYSSISQLFCFSIILVKYSLEIFEFYHEIKTPMEIIF